ncbi:MAG: hypothetical protein GC203_11015 [Phenylobacterium sp.]|uniref:hypothetical protein n=1 Tax=Phenylobacterium sp. TaxID=1871053 RepID=UPI0025E0D330|nr:hypothetical protein [Phenylobacterium sp.]MBI1198382.1 hypothetical protein [Phenylobacterium sp.]
MTLAGSASVGGGAVRLSSATLGLLVDGYVDSWTVGTATTGTNGDWVRAGGGSTAEGNTARTPTPAVSRTFNDTTYVFPVTATNAYGTSNTATITINIMAGAASWGDKPTGGFNDNFAAAVIGSVAIFEANFGTAIIMSTGVNRGNTGISIQDLAFAGPSYVTLRDADPARPGLYNQCALARCNYIDVNAINCGQGAPKTIQTGRFLLAGSQHWSLTNCTAIDAKDDPPLQTGGGVYAILLVGSGSTHCSNWIIENFISEGQFGGIKEASTTGLVHDGVVNGIKIRWSRDNAMFWTTWTDIQLNDVWIVSNLIYGGLHPDQIQRADQHSATRVTINRLFTAVAGGDYPQGLWHGAAGASTEVDFTINNGLIVESQQAGVAFSCNDGGLVKNVTLYAATTPPEPPITNGGSFYADGAAGVWPNPVNIRRVYAFGKKLEENSGGFSEGIGVIFRNNGGTQANDFSTPNPTNILDSITTEEWDAMTFQEIFELHNSIFTPGSNLAVGDGTYIGAFDADGNWNEAG